MLDLRDVEDSAGSSDVTSGSLVFNGSLDKLSALAWAPVGQYSIL